MINLINAYMFGINDCERKINLLIFIIDPGNLRETSKRSSVLGFSLMDDK